MNTIRVALADDHPVVRNGVRSILESAEEICIVAEVGDGDQALAAVASHRPDVLLTDISMPGLTGLDLAERITHEYPQTRVLILSMHKEKSYATRALAAGATGYVLKDSGPAELVAAVRAVGNGENYLSPALSGHLVSEYNRLTRAAESPVEPLTVRQKEVLQLIAKGLPNKVIARALDISVKTVEAHRCQLMERLGIRDVAGLVLYAVRTGLISVDD